MKSFELFMERVWTMCPAKLGTTQTYIQWREQHISTLKKIYFENYPQKIASLKDAESKSKKNLENSRHNRT